MFALITKDQRLRVALYILMVDLHIITTFLHVFLYVSIRHLSILKQNILVA